MVKLSMKEEKTFLKLVRVDKFTAAMSSIRNNLLRTSNLDNHVTANVGNDETFLPSLRSSLRRCDMILLQGMDISLEYINSAAATKLSSTTNTDNDDNSPNS